MLKSSLMQLSKVLPLRLDTRVPQFATPVDTAQLAATSKSNVQQVHSEPTTTGAVLLTAVSAQLEHIALQQAYRHPSTVQRASSVRKVAFSQLTVPVELTIPI